MMEEEDVVTGNSSYKIVSTGHNASMLSYDLNKTLKENEGPYVGIFPEKRNEWFLVIWEGSSHLLFRKEGKLRKEWENDK
ncbi:hypothetical protein AHAS_Ahas02G0079800 [Arachis hypogaea]